MEQKQCDYCRKFYRGSQKETKCKVCEKEFHTIIAFCIKRFKGALKSLSNK